MENRPLADRLSLEQSSVWVDRLKLDNPEDLAAFDRWLLQSEDHVHHFLLMVALDQELRHLDPDRVVSIIKKKASTPLISWRLLAGVAAALALVLVGVSSLSPPASSAEWQNYQTSLGEHPTIKLPDGTEVLLNGTVQMSARISSNVREVRLQGGEALFKVSHDESREFQVSTPEAKLVALGTKFNVKVRKGSTVVDIVEGRVGAQPRKVLDGLLAAVGKKGAETTVLTRGSRGLINDSGKLEVARNPNVEQTIAWTTGNFQFTNTPLWEIAEQFNQYNKTQIKLVGETVQKELVSGSYVTSSPESLVKTVVKTNDWIYRTLPDGTLEIRAPGSR